MPTPILATKLYIPPPRPKVVPRPRLIARLHEGLHGKLTLVSAPAGFGKTTLVSEWLAACARPVAWLSLDAGDSDPTRFLAYLVAALQTLVVGLGEGVLAALESPQPPSVESLLTALLNEITTMPDDFMLVLDDYHVIDAKPIDQALAFLLEHLPPRMHLVITTREDPNLPLARLRARGLMTELRAADLRFTPSEAATFLKEAMGLDLAAADIAALEDRTEGWIAGLQLAALSMRGRADTARFVTAFAGDNRYIVDYLVEEVLQRQPDRVHSFLLQTSILDRLSGPLCDAVTDQNDGMALLDTLERGNLFVVSLDDKRQWYRYHHLFVEVLSVHLREERPAQVATLHRRASAWHEEHGSTDDAIRHALAAQEFARVADLVELALPAMRRGRQETTLLAWFRALPDAVIRSRPVLCAGYAHVLLGVGTLHGVEERLRDAERWLGTLADSGEQADAPPGMVVIDWEEFRRIPGAIAVARAGLALARGDLAATVAYARLARDRAHEAEHFVRGAAAGFLGLAAWTSGDLEAAHETYAEGMAHLQLAGNIADAIAGNIVLADIRIEQGRLRAAMRTYARGLQLAAEHGTPTLRGTADMHVGMSALYREQNNLQAATQHLLISKQQGEFTGFPQFPYRWRMAMARLCWAQGDLDSALDLFHEAERLYVPEFFPNVRPVATWVARVWVAQGRLDEALGWARARGLSAAGDLSYLREFEHITLARVLLARHKIDRTERSIFEATGLLDRLLTAAETGERTGSVIEILVVQALARQAHGDIPAALAPLERALTLAEPEGYVRMFVDEGPPMAHLLAKALTQGIAPHYVGHLLTALGKADRTSVTQAVIEPPSERELEVLRLLGTALSGPDIARQLMVSLNTLRTHTKHIYDKLGVNNRQAAVRRAEELHLF